MKRVALFLATICILAFSCDQFGFGDTTDNIFNLSYEVAADGGVVDVNLEAGMKYIVEIPNDAKSWLSVDDSINKDDGKLRFIVAQNQSAEKRQAIVKLVNSEKKLLLEITITQFAGSSNGEDNVSDFEDCEIDNQHKWK